MNFTYSSQRKNFGGAPLKRDIHYSEPMPYSYSRYWTGTSLQWRLVRRISLKRDKYHLHPHISLSCKLVSVPYRENEYDLLNIH